MFKSGGYKAAGLEPTIAPAKPEERSIIEALFELYIYDFSGALGIDVEPEGRFHPPPLEAYWSEPGRHPFLIRVGDKLAGFALVGSKSRLTDADNVHDLAEFFILRKYRRKRIGEQAACFIFDAFPGPWEVRQRMENTEATEFWRAAIGRYAKGRFVELMWEDTRWRGPVQRFEAG